MHQNMIFSETKLNQMKITKQNKTGVILAAGLGSRMNKQEAVDIVKPLTEIDSLGLLLRTIHSLEKASCIEVVIVLGWKADEIQNNIEENYKGDSKLQFVYWIHQSQKMKSFQPLKRFLKQIEDLN